MSVAVSIISTIIKSAIKSKVGNELSNELIGISVDSVSEKGLSKINDFIDNGKSKVENILSEEKMKSMDIPEDNIAYIVAEIKDLLSEIEITDDIFRQCKFDSLNLCSFLWEKYSENKTDYIECESDIKKSLLTISEALIKLLRESEEFVKDISIQISNTVDDSRVEIQRISDYLEENFSKMSSDNQKIFDILREILEQNQKSKKENNITQEEKFQNNKKDEYLKIWNSRMFLHIDNNENPITLADAFIMPDYDFRMQVGRIKFRESDTIGDVINKFVKYDATSSMLITGAPGIGKTSITAWMANEFKDDEDVLILRFRDLDSEELDNGLLKAMYNTLKCKKKELENKILILDGFDEIKAMDNRDFLLNSFFNDILDYDNLKIIVTSRPNYIDPHGFHNYFELLPFDIKKVSKFYEKIKGAELDKNKIDCGNLNVIGIPVILYMAIMSDVDLTQKTTKPELYGRIFAKTGGIFDKFCYEGIGYDKGNQILRDKKNVEKYLKFLGEIAFAMFEKNDLILNKKEYEVPGLDFQGDSIQIMEFPIKYIFDNTESTIEFIHNSIYEYFVSEYVCFSICEEIDMCKPKEDFAGILGKMFKDNILSFEILEFLKFKVLNDKLKNKFDIVREVFQIMIQDGMTFYTGKIFKNVMDCEMNVFKNMLEFIHLWNVSFIRLDNCPIKFIGYNYKFRLNLKKFFLRTESLQGMDLRKIDFEYVDLQGVNLSKVNLQGVNLSRSNLMGANLMGANLKAAKLKRADLRKTNLWWADLSNADLRNVNLEKVKIGKSILKEVEENNNRFSGRIYNINLSKANLNKANLKGAILKRANLCGTNLKEANLYRTILTFSEFRKANIINADLRRANLMGADLRGADLRGADLRGADLRGADLTFAKFDDKQITYLSNCDLSKSLVYLEECNRFINYLEYQM